MTAEWTLPDPKGTEVTVRRGEMFRADDVVVSVYDAEGNGASCYLTPDEALRMASKLTDLGSEPNA